MRVVAVEGFGAWCEGRGERRWLDLSLLGAQPSGTWVLGFLDSAREVLSAERACQINAALDALEASLRGELTDIDALFPDLAGREPQLPAHLTPGARAP